MMKRQDGMFAFGLYIFSQRSLRPQYIDQDMQTEEMNRRAGRKLRSMAASDKRATY